MFCCAGAFLGFFIGLFLGGIWPFILGGIGFLLGFIFDLKFMHKMHGKTLHKEVEHTH